MKKDQFSADPLYAAQLKAFDRAIELDPDNAEAWFNQGYALCGMKRYDEGINAFEKVAILDPAYPHPEANLRIAQNLRNSSLPFYLRYGPVLFCAAIIAAAGFAIWCWSKRGRKRERLPEERKGFRWKNKK